MLLSIFELINRKSTNINYFETIRVVFRTKKQITARGLSPEHFFIINPSIGHHVPGPEIAVFQIQKNNSTIP